MPLSRRLKFRHPTPIQATQLRDGLRERGTRPPRHTSSLSAGPPDRNPAVDRETARKNMTAGLVAGGFAAAIFALSFIVAFLYIAS